MCMCSGKLGAAAVSHLVSLALVVKGVGGPRPVRDAQRHVFGLAGVERCQIRAAAVAQVQLGFHLDTLGLQVDTQ